MKRLVILLGTLLYVLSLTQMSGCVRKSLPDGRPRYCIYPEYRENVECLEKNSIKHQADLTQVEPFARLEGTNVKVFEISSRGLKCIVITGGQNPQLYCR